MRGVCRPKCGPRPTRTNGLGSRPTQDLDFFTRPGGGDVGLAKDEFIAAASARDWVVGVIRDSDTFVRELAGRKVVALFDRAAARDFVDVFAVDRIYDREQLLTSAAEDDGGFDRLVFADMLDSIALP